MESTSENGKIQVSAMSYDLLKSNFLFIERGMVECKGLGPIKTHFLLGKM
jgi:hypothetical protein